MAEGGDCSFSFKQVEMLFRETPKVRVRCPGHLGLGFLAPVKWGLLDSKVWIFWKDLVSFGMRIEIAVSLCLISMGN
jgi:hypothetical protein